MVLGNSSPLLGDRVSQLADPMAPVDPQDTAKQVITVKPGATAGDIGTDLQQRGLIRSALAFRLAPEQAGVGSSLAAGDYELSRSMSTNAIVQVLASGVGRCAARHWRQRLRADGASTAAVLAFTTGSRSSRRSRPDAVHG